MKMSSTMPEIHIPQSDAPIGPVVNPICPHVVILGSQYILPCFCDIDEGDFYPDGKGCKGCRWFADHREEIEEAARRFTRYLATGER